MPTTTDELLSKMPEIVRATRVQLNYWKSQSWAMTVQMSREWLTVHAGSAEVAEGLASFHEKRHVDYEGLRSSIENAGAGPSDSARAGSALDQEIHDV